jgi:hypothetical protein
MDWERVGELGGRGLWLAFSAVWKAVGIALFATLAILEPVVCWVLSAMASLGLLTTLLFGVVMGAPGYPVGFMLGMSIGCFVLLGLYYALMRCFGDLG